MKTPAWLLALSVRRAAERIKHARMCNIHGIFRDDRGICMYCELDAQKRSRSISEIIAASDARFSLA